MVKNNDLLQYSTRFGGSNYFTRFGIWQFFLRSWTCTPNLFSLSFEDSTNPQTPRSTKSCVTLEIQEKLMLRPSQYTACFSSPLPFSLSLYQFLSFFLFVRQFEDVVMLESILTSQSSYSSFPLLCLDCSKQRTKTRKMSLKKFGTLMCFCSANNSTRRCVLPASQTFVTYSTHWKFLVKKSWNVAFDLCSNVVFFLLLLKLETLQAFQQAR